jgi:tetratricopeptide (TPR) repeat protein
MRNKDPRITAMREEIRKLSKRLVNVENKYRQAIDKDRKRTLALHVDDIRSKIGWLLLDSGEYDKGLAIYKAMSWHTYAEDKYNGISRALIEMEYYDDARRILGKGLKRFPQSYCLLVAMGLLHKRLGHEVDALKYFEQALVCSPGDKDVLYDKAITLSELGYYEDSLSIIKKLIKKYPDDSENFIEAGYCHLMMGYPENAIRYYKKASNKGFLSPTIYGGLVSAYMDMGLKHEALEMALEGMREFPEAPGMYENLGEVYFEYGWINEAKQVLEEGVKKFPEDERLKEVLKKIEDETNDPDKNKKPPFICIMLFLSLILKKLERKTKPNLLKS